MMTEWRSLGKMDGSPSKDPFSDPPTGRADEKAPRFMGVSMTTAFESILGAKRASC